MMPFYKITTSKYVLLLFIICLPVQLLLAQNVEVHYEYSRKDTAAASLAANLKKTFTSLQTASAYIKNLPQELLAQGFPVAAVDSVVWNGSSAKVYVYAGIKYFWSIIYADSLPEMVRAQTGLKAVMRNFSLKDFESLTEKILDHYENDGHPFAKISIQDVKIHGDSLSGRLFIDEGKLYKIDSIRVYGGAKISNGFLQKYLGIENGSNYSNRKLQQISRRIGNLPFLQESAPWSVMMLGTGATLNLYLEAKKSSSADVLIGFSPSDEVTGKAKISADVNLNLRNVFALGENLILNWQQLQPRSPKLHLAYEQPFILKSNYGIDLSFRLFKQDSAYLDVEALIGLKHSLSESGDITVFYKTENRYLLEGAINPGHIIHNKKLPQNIDVRSQNAGVALIFNTTDHQLNPRGGREVYLEGTAGVKNYRQNTEVLELADPERPDFKFASLYDSIKLKNYRFALVGRLSQYFAAGKSSVLKLEVDAGTVQSPQLFFNELFRLGGYRLLRGFDEESVFVSKYGVFTAEYRYITGTNSYFFIFSDAALTGTNAYKSSYSNTFISAGVGLKLETDFGLLNISYAIGKRNDLKFDLRNSSRIHFGYINYF